MGKRNIPPSPPRPPAPFSFTKAKDVHESLRHLDLIAPSSFPDPVADQEGFGEFVGSLLIEQAHASFAAGKRAAESEALALMARAMTAPRMLILDAQGQPIGVEPQMVN